ncbi:response regulator [Flagellimonas zhangzhouensis]|nr:response regulator [Allomuricauda zhangzhouensis]
MNSIFIVDDDPITVFGIKKMLKPVAGCADIQIFQNGKEALNEIQERVGGSLLPEVIFLDINMPILDGWGFLEELISMNIQQPITINVITSSIDPLDLEKWYYYKARCPHTLNFKNKPIFKIELADLGYINVAS